MITREIIKKLESKFNNSSSKFNQELCVLLKNKTINLIELKLYYQFKINELENQIDRTTHNDLRYDYETYCFRLSQLTKQMSDSQNKKVEQIQNQIDKYRKDIQEHNMIITSDIEQKIVRDIREEIFNECVKYNLRIQI